MSLPNGYAENVTDVTLLRVPLNNDYKHTLYFDDVISQRNYFTSSSLNSIAFDNFSYIPQDSKLRVHIRLDEARKYNYVMYKNINYPNNKWFYAFITDYKWLNDEVTELTLETDVIQSWMFNINIKPSFIEREHTNDDTVGVNTIPENLETGEYIVNMTNEITPFTAVNIVVGVTMSPAKVAYRGTLYTGCYSGIKYYSFDFNTAGITRLNNFLKLYDEQGVNDAIVSMFLAPSELAKRYENMDSVETSENPYNSTFSIKKPSTFNGYIPKNKKLFTYPYNYLLASNNAGGSAIYQFEHFEEGEIMFIVYGVLTPGCSIRMIPMNYKGILTNNEEGLNLGKYPICNWTSDEFTNWLTQNSVNIGVNLVSGLGQIVGGGALALASGGLGTFIGGGAITGGVSSIVNQLTQIHQMSFTPPQANGNLNSGDVTTAIGKNTFTLYQMCSKPEYMKVIDEFFDMFGYKTSRVKVPNKNHRENWWYTKTIDINISASSVPMSDINKIKDCYNNGITFWKNGSNIGDYSLSNNII